MEYELMDENEKEILYRIFSSSYYFDLSRNMEKAKQKSGIMFRFHAHSNLLIP